MCSAPAVAGPASLRHWPGVPLLTQSQRLPTESSTRSPPLWATVSAVGAPAAVRGQRLRLVAGPLARMAAEGDVVWTKTAGLALVVLVWLMNAALPVPVMVRKRPAWVPLATRTAALPPPLAVALKAAPVPEVDTPTAVAVLP